MTQHSSAPIKQLKYFASERLGFSPINNYVSYYIGPYKIDIITSRNEISLINSTNFIIDPDDLIDIIIKTLNIDKKKVRFISIQEIYIGYDLDSLNKYFEYVFFQKY